MDACNCCNVFLFSKARVIRLDWNNRCRTWRDTTRKSEGLSTRQRWRTKRSRKCAKYGWSQNEVQRLLVCYQRCFLDRRGDLNKSGLVVLEPTRLLSPHSGAFTVWEMAVADVSCGDMCAWFNQNKSQDMRTLYDTAQSSFWLYCSGHDMVAAPQWCHIYPVAAHGWVHEMSWDRVFGLSLLFCGTIIVQEKACSIPARDVVQPCRWCD